jgi:hypothetical protein
LEPISKQFNLEDSRLIRFFFCAFLQDHDFIGEVYTTIGEVVGARGALSKKLSNPKIANPGVIVRT